MDSRGELSSKGITGTVLLQVQMAVNLNYPEKFHVFSRCQQLSDVDKHSNLQSKVFAEDKRYKHNKRSCHNPKYYFLKYLYLISFD